MDYRQMTGPCGLDCFNCPPYLANENEDLRTLIAEHLGIPFEQAVCQGCRNEKGECRFVRLFHNEPCRVYKCTEKKGIDFCYDCSDFPCDHLHPYADRASEVPHNIKLFNLCLIKKMGLESWVETKAKSVRDTYHGGRWKL